MKKFLSLLISIFILFGTGGTSLAAYNPQETIAENIKRLQQIKEDVDQTNKQISDLNSSISKLNSEVIKDNANIAKNNKLIETEKTNMEKLSKEVDDAQKLANSRFRAMYINSYTENFIMLLLTAENFSDFFYRYEVIERIIALDKRVLNELSEKKKTLNKIISDLDFKAKELQQLKKSNEERLKELNGSKQKLQDLIVKLDKEKASAALMIKENEEKLIAHAVSAITSSSSSISEMKSALLTLNSLVPQINTDSVKKKAKDYINSGNKKLDEMIAKAEAEAKAKAEEEAAKDEVSEAPSDADYKASYTMTATAYTGGSFTAIGLKPVRNPGGLSTIAVDPSVIPLGSKVYIPGYGYAIASDTGGAIKGNIIDLYLNSVDECLTWGRRKVILHIVAYPGEW